MKEEDYEDDDHEEEYEDKENYWRKKKAGVNNSTYICLNKLTMSNSSSPK